MEKKFSAGLEISHFKNAPNPQLISGVNERDGGAPCCE